MYISWESATQMMLCLHNPQTLNCSSVPGAAFPHQLHCRMSMGSSGGAQLTLGNNTS